MRRAKAASQRRHDLMREARAAAEARFGKPPRGSWEYLNSPFKKFLDEHPATQAAARVPYDDIELCGWRATPMKDRSIVFHHYMRPVRVWAVSIAREGLVWAEAEIVKITATCISVVYKDVRAPLKRPLKLYGSWWRGVRFVGERSGLTAKLLEEQWREQYGHLVPERMPLEQARQMLGLPTNYTEEDVITAFRRAAKRCHPDMGGTAEMFRKLVEARDRLLASIGTSAPPPKEPDFTPRGYKTVYVTISSRTRRVGGRRLLQGGRQHLGGRGTDE
jgi:hypothetical protein